ncbi:hypothetical protein [Streptomyces sp. NPDC059753]|uniref:hypothetical protein n=1 Tax=Streptomyces sp. NPDC059753 TaxID=3346933 RepID=UPI003667BD06
MPISHSVDGDTLRVTLHHSLDVHTRAAAAAEIEALVHTHRPRHVTVQAPAGDRPGPAPAGRGQGFVLGRCSRPTPATLSAIVRAHRMCKKLDIPSA